MSKLLENLVKKNQYCNSFGFTLVNNVIEICQDSHYLSLAQKFDDWILRQLIAKNWIGHGWFSRVSHQKIGCKIATSAC